MGIKRIRKVDTPRFYTRDLHVISALATFTQTWYISDTGSGHHLLLSQVPPMIKDTCRETSSRDLEVTTQEKPLAEMEILLQLREPGDAPGIPHLPRAVSEQGATMLCLGPRGTVTLLGFVGGGGSCKLKLEEGENQP